MDQTQSSKDLSYDIISYIMRNALGPFDVLRASAVSREWRRAAQEQYLWQAFVRREFGDTLLRKAARTSGSGSGQVDAKAFYAQMACFQPGALTGWCEDPVTASGNPYAMYLGEMSSNSSTYVRDHGSIIPMRRASLAHTCTIECRCFWTYTVPHPRTRVRMYAMGVQPEVIDGLRALPVATRAITGAPLYSQRIKVVEYEKIVGPVDVPNSYFSFRVGPVLLGCFLPPEIQLHVVALRTRKQMLGLIVLWDAGLSLPGNPGPCPAPLQSLLDLTGLSVGEVFTGTVLTNWQQRDTSSGLKLGHVLMGCIKVTCLAIGPSLLAPHQTHHPTPSISPSWSQSDISGEPHATSSASVPSVQARLLVEVAEREWLISPQGLPVRYDIEDEPSYTAAVTEEAWVTVHPDGTLKPLAPSDVSRQARNTGTGAGDAAARQFDAFGITSGGVLSGMLIRKANTAHRAVFAAFAGSLGHQELQQ